MNACLRVLKETKWIPSFLTCLLKFIEYFPDYRSALSRTLLRFFGQPLSKQLYVLAKTCRSSWFVAFVFVLSDQLQAYKQAVIKHTQAKDELAVSGKEQTNT